MPKKMSSLDKGTASYKKKVGNQLKSTSNFDVNVSTYPTPYRDLLINSYPASKGYQESGKRLRRSSKQRYKNDLSDEIYANATSGLRKVATRPLKKK